MFREILFNLARTASASVTECSGAAAVLASRRYFSSEERTNAGVMADEKFSGVIPVEELTIRHSRSSGPGGQNVNKVNSKVTMKFHVDSCSWIPEWIKPRLKEQFSNRISKNGEFVVQSEKTRHQNLNQADCLDMIRRSVWKASTLPKEPDPEKTELWKNRLKAHKERMIEERQRRSMKLKLKNPDF